MRRTAILMLAIAAQAPIGAQALSCMQPDIVASYTRAAEASEPYLVLKGKFRFTPPPRQPVDNDTSEQTVPARFEGVALSRSDFNISYSRPVTLTLACAGPWCGWVEPDTDAIAFVEQRGTELVLLEGPCPGQIFYEPTREQADRLLLCHRQGICD